MSLGSISSNPFRLSAALDIADMADVNKTVNLERSISTFSCEECKDILESADWALADNPEFQKPETLNAILDTLMNTLDLAVTQSQLETAQWDTHTLARAKDLSSWIEDGTHPPDSSSEAASVVIDIERQADADEFFDARDYFPDEIRSGAIKDKEPDYAAYGPYSKPPPDKPRCPASLFSCIRACARFITHNEASSDAGRQICNVANIGIRTIFSVFLPTYCRQLILYAIKDAVASDDLRQEVRTAICGCIAALPILLNVVGWRRDELMHTATDESRGARGVNIAAGGIALVAAGILGELPELMGHMAAFNSYCALREAAQRILSLSNDGPQETSLAPTAGAALAYLPNQFAVSYGMTEFAPGQAHQDHLVRAALNLFGETLDTWLLAQANHVGHKAPHRTKLECYSPSWKRGELWHEVTRVAGQAPDILLGSVAARTALFTNLVLTKSVAGQLYLKDLPEHRKKAIDALLDGAILSGGYIPYSYIAAERRQRPPASDWIAV